MTKDDVKKIEYTQKKIEKAKAEFEKMKAGQIATNERLFEFFKPDIESVLVELEIMMTGFILQVERTYSLEELNWYAATEEDCAYYVAEDIKNERRRVNRALRKIKKYFDECRV